MTYFVIVMNSQYQWQFGMHAGICGMGFVRKLSMKKIDVIMRRFNKNENIIFSSYIGE